MYANRNRKPKYDLICKFYFTDRVVKKYLQSADVDAIAWESYSVTVAIMAVNQARPLEVSFPHTVLNIFSCIHPHWVLCGPT